MGALFRRRSPPAPAAPYAAQATVADTAVESDVWTRYLSRLITHGLNLRSRSGPNPATVEDEERLYQSHPSFVDLLPWAEFLPDTQSMLLDDGTSVAAFFELVPVGTEGREEAWLQHVRDAVEDALQDSCAEHDDSPWVLQFYAADETDWDDYLRALKDCVHPRARGTAFTELYLKLFEHHLRAISKPGGFFQDTAVSQLPWRGQIRRIRMVVYRRSRRTNAGRGEAPEQELTSTTERLAAALGNAGVAARRMDARAIHAWLLRWFNPHPTMLGPTAADRERFYRLTGYPPESQPGDVELASGTDFAERLFFNQPHSDVQRGAWHFDGQPHRVIVVDRLRAPPTPGHLTGERRRGGNAINAVFDQLPEGAVLCITLVVTPQDTLEERFNRLGRKSVGDTIDSEQTRRDLQQARSIIGSAHKLYRAAIAVYVRGRDSAELDARSLQVANVLLGAGLQPVKEGDEVAPLNSYLRWLPACYDPTKDSRHVFTQLMFAQHVANLIPVWGRSYGTGNPGITMFNRGGGTTTFDMLRDRRMNAHMLMLGPTGSGKSATLNTLLTQTTAIYRPRLFVVEAGNSFGLWGDFAQRLGLRVHRVKLAPGSDVSLAPFVDAIRLVKTPSQVKTLEIEPPEEPESPPLPTPEEDDEPRDVLGELELTARLMITGGEEKEEARMTRADRSLIRQCILDAAHECARDNRPVLTQDIRDALRHRAADPSLPDVRRVRLFEMADAMDIFCQGTDGRMFNRAGSAWPEADITIIDLATFAREGYGAQLSIAYVSLLNAINNIIERDQFLGLPTIVLTDEGHVVLKVPLIPPFVVKITKMWRKLNGWWWLATQNLDDIPRSAETLLNMIEWWWCLNMPPDEVEKIAKFRELTPAQKALLLSARKESHKHTEGVVLGRGLELLIRVVPPSLNLATSMTEPEEKNERYELMREDDIDELDAAILVAARIDRARGIEPLVLNELAA